MAFMSRSFLLKILFFVIQAVVTGKITAPMFNEE